MHAYIISGRKDAALPRARELAAAALCEGTGEKPCRVCRHCRKVFQGDFPGIHPDVTVISRQPDTSGKLRRDIVVSQIRALVLDASVLPNEAGGKVYIFPEADTMNAAAQNAFLKVLEEPPAGVLFLLCAERRELLLETVQSRCGEIRLSSADGPDASDDTYRCAEGFLDARNDRAELLRCCVAMENLDRALLTEVVEAAESLAVRKIRDAKELLAMEAFLRRAAEYLRLNVGVKHVTGYLSTYLPGEPFPAEFSE